MPEVETPVDVVRVEYRCDCGGEMVSTGLSHMSLPPSYNHRCEGCDYQLWLDVLYPTIRYVPRETKEGE